MKAAGTRRKAPKVAKSFRPTHRGRPRHSTPTSGARQAAPADDEDACSCLASSLKRCVTLGFCCIVSLLLLNYYVFSNMTLQSRRGGSGHFLGPRVVYGHKGQQGASGAAQDPRRASAAGGWQAGRWDAGPPPGLAAGPAAVAVPPAPPPVPTLPMVGGKVRTVSPRGLGPVAESGGIARLDGESWLVLREAVDSEELLLGAWIYLEELRGSYLQSSSSIKTVASTKISGCTTNTQGTADGWAFFVNEWGTQNRQLRLSWTDVHSACNELYSPTALVPYNEWVHVGFTLSVASSVARIYLNGEVIADTKAGMGLLGRAGQSVPLGQVFVSARQLQRTSSSLYYGAHALSSRVEHVHAFYGYLADLRVVQSAPEPAVAKQVMLMSSSDLAASGLAGKALKVQLMLNQTSVVQANTVSGQAFAREPHTIPDGFLMWALNPKMPSYVPSAPGQAPAYHPMAGDQPTVKPLSDEELRRTWPAEWLKRFSDEQLLKSQRDADVWAEEVREAARWSWRGYKEHAWGHDELKPNSGSYSDWCKMAVTMVDSLSTLWLLGLTTEFNEAADYLKQHPVPFRGHGHGYHSVFEMTIRVLAGLLSAYALSGDKAFLEMSRSVGEALLAAYNTPSGMPMGEVDVGTGSAKHHAWTRFFVLAEVGTVQVELRFLSHALGDRRFAKAADRSMEAIFNAKHDAGLVPIYLTRQEEIPKIASGRVSIGAMGDSYYEYLLKVWLQTGKREDRYKEEWKTATAAILGQLLRRTRGGLTFIAEKENSHVRMRMDHLACFAAGMLIMGARSLPPDEVDPRWEPTAEEITMTCWEMYKRTPSGLSPEYTVYNVDKDTPEDTSVPKDAPQNLLRPEAAEAAYYMHYYTGDPKYRKMAYDIFQGFQRNSRTKHGYVAVKDVRHDRPRQGDAMESFWMAETLKYLYLAFAPRSALSLETYVLNTEAHPLPVWSESGLFGG